MSSRSFAEEKHYMNIYIKEHIKMHPELMPRDIIKFCYQAAYGAEHLLSDKEYAGKMLHDEFENTLPSDIPLFEKLSDNYCRVNIAAWRFKGFSEDLLQELFLESVSDKAHHEKEDFHTIIKLASEVISDSCTKEFLAEWNNALSDYIASGIRPVHHSEHYREIYSPAYRVVDFSLLKEKCPEPFPEKYSKY